MLNLKVPATGRFLVTLDESAARNTRYSRSRAPDLGPPCHPARETGWAQLIGWGGR